jgi:hypothetical protein
LNIHSRSHPIDGDQQLLFEYDENFDRVRSSGRGRGRHSMDDEEFEDEARAEESIEAEVLRSIPPDHPDRERIVREAIEGERRLQQDLRAAGLL